MRRAIQFSSEQFTNKAVAFFKSKPEQADGLPTIWLLLYLEPMQLHYIWYFVREKDKLAESVEFAMENGLAPVGAALLSFENRGGRICLSEHIEHFVHGFFDAEEVLNGTIPYFMRSEFGYE